MDKPLIEISHLSKTYGSNIALNDISLTIQPQKIIGLLGPNGSGKTTFIKILLGFLRQYIGEVYIEGKSINDPTNATLSKSFIAYLPDKNHIPLDWSIDYACGFFEDFFADFSKSKARDLCKQLNLNPLSKLKTLSKGNQEKVGLLLTLARNAKLYIFDEPIAGVDPVAREQVFNLILENCNKDASIIIATHLIYDVQKILDEAIFLSYGRVLLHKPISELVTEQKNLEEVFKEYFA